MSRANKRGMRAIPTLDQTGNIRHVVVPAASALAAIHDHRMRKVQKQNKEAFRAFKRQLREAKKSIPLDQRAAINWSEIKSEVRDQPGAAA